MTQDTGKVSAERIAKSKRRSFLMDLFVRLIKEKPLGVIGGLIVLLLVVVAVLADVLAPYGVNETSPLDMLSPPSAAFLLGTDQLGRDLLSRIIYGARISLYVGLISTTLAVLLGTLVGLISGFSGGKTDLLIQRIVDALMCFPTLLVLLTVISIVGPGLWQVIFAIAFTRAYRQSRIFRGAVIGIKENLYVEAARATGVPVSRILGKHILPNIMPVVIIVFSVEVGQTILLEAFLSFLGFGVPPPAPSWGGILSQAREYLFRAPWLALWPGVALALAIWGINMLGDAVRDILDPKLRGGLGRYSGVKKKATRIKVSNN